MKSRVKEILKKYIPAALSGRIAVLVLLFWILTALLSPFIANNKPILAKGSQGWSMPIWSKSEMNENEKYAFSINPMVTYRFDDLDLENTFKPPFSSGKKGMHILGTDKLGRDILAGMINGARVAFIVATSVILFSSILGIFVGLLIGFYGDTGIKKNLFQQLFLILLLIYLIYYFIHLFKEGISLNTLTPIIILGIAAYFGNLLLDKIPLKKYGLPIDIFVQRLFEINESLPGLFIILAFVAIVTKTTLLTIAAIMTFLMWMTFARHARAEAMQIREEEYIASAKASGISDFRLIIRHILPNALPSLLVVTAFSYSGVILMESTLSFLGIGLPLEEVSWGKILAEARRTPKAWWLAVFPGMAIFLVLYSFNILGDILATFQRQQK